MRKGRPNKDEEYSEDGDKWIGTWVGISGGQACLHKCMLGFQVMKNITKATLSAKLTLAHTPFYVGVTDTQPRPGPHSD